MQSSITEIRFTSPGGKVNVYIFCKPQYILESSPAGPVAKGLWGNFTPLHSLHSTPSPSSLIPPTPPLQIAWVYVPGPPVNFLPRVHRYADISGINLPLRIVMPMQMYTRLLSVFAFCMSGCWFTQEISLSVSVDNTDKGRTDIWDKWWPNCVPGDWAAVNKLATLELLIL